MLFRSALYLDKHLRSRDGIAVVDPPLECELRVDLSKRGFSPGTSAEHGTLARHDPASRGLVRGEELCCQVATSEVFFQRPLLIAADPEHSQGEPRYAALGWSAAGRRLTIVFTVRGSLLRVISARDMSRRERRIYERPKEKDES